MIIYIYAQKHKIHCLHVYKLIKDIHEADLEGYTVHEAIALLYQVGNSVCTLPEHGHQNIALPDSKSSG